jgi:hypothetical protein
LQADVGKASRSIPRRSERTLACVLKGYRSTSNRQPSTGLAIFGLCSVVPVLRPAANTSLETARARAISKTATRHSGRGA